jgi:hypothetical protein
VIVGIDTEALEAVYINILNVFRGRFHDDLKLIVMLETVRILAVATVGGPPGGLDIRGVPGFRPETAKQGGRVKCTRAHLHVVRLLDDTAPVRPEFLQCKYEVLEVHAKKSTISIP